MRCYLVDGWRFQLDLLWQTWKDCWGRPSTYYLVGSVSAYKSLFVVMELLLQVRLMAQQIEVIEKPE